MSDILLNFRDNKVKHTITFPTGKNWDDYLYILVEMYVVGGSTPLQTSGYTSESDPGITWDNDLVVPDVDGSIAYMKIESSVVEDICSPLVWVLKWREADSSFTDEYYDGGDKLKKLVLEGI
jgi:hypothetical protein